MAIEARHITKQFGDYTALDDVTVVVPDGSLTALLGPSGSGKSTLLRVIAGLEVPDAGQVLIEGEDVTNKPARTREVGFVFQHYAAFKHMTVADNVALRAERAQAPEGRDQGARGRAARARRPGAPRQALPVAALRRPAPADGAGARAGGRAARAAARRAVRRSGRPRARGAARLAAAAARRGARDDDLRHARPGGGDGDRRADRGRQRGPDRAVGVAGRDLRRARLAVRDDVRRARSRAWAGGSCARTTCRC